MNIVRIVTMWQALFVAMLLVVGCAATPGKISQVTSVPDIDATHGVGLEGYDAVAYFTDSKPVPGNDSTTHVWHGATWKFTSAEHRDLFAADPERYAPQFGGYCAYAVSRGTTAHGDPLQWAVVNNRLFVNTNAFAMSLWDRDRPGNIAAADQNWPLIPKSAVAASDR